MIPALALYQAGSRLIYKEQVILISSPWTHEHTSPGWDGRSREK